MKILVFDDNPVHREAAQAQFTGHDLTIVGTYDEARKLLITAVDHEKSWALRPDILEEMGLDRDYDPNGKGEAANKKFWEADTKAKEQATHHPDFDVVLTDLLVPASKDMLGNEGEQYIGMEMPVGVFIGLLAAVKGGAKHVAVFTDSDHHSHPASACFDAFNEHESEPTPFVVNGCKVLLCNNRKWVGLYDPKDLATELEYRTNYTRTDTVYAKNWAALLEYLLK
jgi:CheY-like chemotaxis protein